jgi:hypothetical protein
MARYRTSASPIAAAVILEIGSMMRPAGVAITSRGLAMPRHSADGHFPFRAALLYAGTRGPQARRALLELLGHAQVLLEMRQGLRRPALELRIIPALGIGFEQCDRLFVALDLGLIVALVEVLAALRF